VKAHGSRFVVELLVRAPFVRAVPERKPPRRPDEISRVDVGELVRASPERARSFCTVRAAISSAVLSDTPRSRSLALMCWYCRALLVS
jgi:hypothetical protein